MKSQIRILASLSFLLLLAPVRADSIDEAEAKRRGVPVAQVQAENALAAEKRKTAELEQKVAELQKKIDELTGQPAAPAAAAALRFDGPRESNPLYKELVGRYLSGDWATLAADLAARQNEIAAMPAGNVADLTYIRQTIAECRPAWWDQAKAGKAMQSHQLVWKQNINFNFQPSPGVRFGGNAVTPNGLLSTLCWPAEQMDSKDPLPLADVDLNIPGNSGLLRGDAINWSIWNMLGGLGILNQLGPARVKALTPDEKKQLDRYSSFCQAVSAAYYGTPPARRIALLQGLSSLEINDPGRTSWIGRRPIGAALLLEIAQHPGRYPLNIEPIIGLESAGPAGMSAESFLAKPVVLQLLNVQISLEEDRELRDLIKTLANSNTNWTSSRISLQGKLSIDLDLDKDGPLAAQRLALINAAGRGGSGPIHAP